MKLVLLSDVKALGKAGDVVDVAEGYGNNFLLPRKLAVEANKGAMALLDAQKRAQQKREAQTLADAKALAERLETAKIAVSAKAGGNGKLFGAVTNADVADAILRELEITLDRHKIEIMSSIKALGSYPVEIKLHKNVVAKATLSVVAA
ncbi:MAG: 50S ribosomal protein L9 [Candidatus Eremiobacteraeota bacterium]|nr:50S ribosomal protein L9 [Candidatus Eremiobacteraeota bacterium]